MKRRYAGLILILALGAFRVQAKLDGTFLHDVGRSYVTPHLEWSCGMPGKPLRVLFISDRASAREAAESAQRADLHFKVFTVFNWATIAAGNVYEGAMSGTTREEKVRELREKLQADYDVIVILKVMFTRLPEDLQFAILDKLRRGTGLVIDSRYPVRYRKVISGQIASPEFMKRFAASLLPADCKAYQFEKGRLVQFSCPPMPEGVMRMAAHENYHALLIQFMRWAGRRESPVHVGCASVQNGRIRTELSGDAKNVTLRIRLRNLWNRIESEIRTAGKTEVSAALPALPAGTYLADIFAERDGRVQDFSVSKFSIASPFGKEELKVHKDFVERKQAIQGTIILGNSPEAGSKLRLSLASHPDGRIWSRREIPWKKGAVSMDFEWTDYYLPSIAGILFAEVIDPGDRVRTRSFQDLFFPNREIPPYFAFGWGMLTSISAVSRLAETFGLNTSLSQFGPQSARSAAFRNQRLIPYMVRITHSRSRSGGVCFLQNFFLTPELRKVRDQIMDDACFYRPEVRKLWGDAIRHKIRNIPQYGIPVYSLGDENNFDANAGFGPSDLIYFRKFLERKYQSVAALNREWKSSYGDFDSVPHPPLEESRKTGNWAAWNDHQEYMEKMYADTHHFCAAEIRRIDPGAKVGSEGSMPGDLEQTIEGMEFWGPYRKLLESEAMRCFGGDRLRTVWYGYHNERGEDKFPLLLRDMLSGVINGMGWFETESYSAMCLLGVDDTPSYRAEFVRELNRIRFGVGELLVRTPLEESGLALYWSHSSRRASQLDPRLISPVDSLSPLIRFLYRNAINFDMVSARTLKHLDSGTVRTLFLAGNSVVGREEAEAILRFVRRGGTVIADMNCGILNRCFRPVERNPLAELFGNLTLTGLKEPQVASVSVREKLNGQLLVFKAGKALSNPGSESCRIRTVGKGTAVLLNFRSQWRKSRRIRRPHLTVS